jgi:hypothetical protein
VRSAMPFLANPMQPDRRGLFVLNRPLLYLMSGFAGAKILLKHGTSGYLSARLLLCLLQCSPCGYARTQVAGK